MSQAFTFRAYLKKNFLILAALSAVGALGLALYGSSIPAQYGDHALLEMGRVAGKTVLSHGEIKAFLDLSYYQRPQAITDSQTAFLRSYGIFQRDETDGMTVYQLALRGSSHEANAKLAEKIQADLQTRHGSEIEDYIKNSKTEMDVLNGDLELYKKLSETLVAQAPKIAVEQGSEGRMLQALTYGALIRSNLQSVRLERDILTKRVEMLQKSISPLRTAPFRIRGVMPLGDGPVWPNRAALAAFGALAGLLVGILWSLKGKVLG